MKKFGFITFSITQDAQSRAIHIATFLSIFVHSQYLHESDQLDAISTQDRTIINNDMISIIVISRFINALINFGNTLIEFVASSQHFLVWIQFQTNGKSVLSFIHKQSQFATASSHAFVACSAFILSIFFCRSAKSASLIFGVVSHKTLGIFRFDLSQITVTSGISSAKHVWKVDIRRLKKTEQIRIFPK